jgi:hypothetical protein
MSIRRFGPIVGALVLACACTPYVTPLGGRGAGATAAEPARDRRELPPGSHDGQEESLLAAYRDRDLPDHQEMNEQWGLTRSAKRIAVAMLIAAAQDRDDFLDELLTEDARFGLPDRREPQARPIAGDREVFFDRFRAAASRFKGKADFTCPPLLPGAEATVSSGAEPMWCFYTSDDGHDMLVFKLVTRADHPRIAYVGLFGERPSGSLRIVGYGPPPPTTPTPKMRGMDDLPSGVTPIRREGAQNESRLERAKPQEGH